MKTFKIKKNSRLIGKEREFNKNKIINGRSGAKWKWVRFKDKKLNGKVVGIKKIYIV